MILLVLLLDAAVSVTPAATPAATRCASAVSAAQQREFLELINASRRKQNLAPLRLSDPLCRAAQKRADDIARAGVERFDAMAGEDILKLVESEGYDARYAGEVLVQATGTPREIAAGWNRDLASDEGFGRPEARELGIGVADLEDTPLYAFLFALEAKEEFQERTAGLMLREDLLREMLEKVNAARRRELKKSGRPPGTLDLRRNSLLDRAAQAHADDMLARSFYGHEDPQGRDAFDRAKAAGYTGWIVGENIAQGQSSLGEVMKGWMGSPDHRKNILSLEYTEAGFGLAVGRNAQGYQVLWVQVFGRPR